MDKCDKCPISFIHNSQECIDCKKSTPPHPEQAEGSSLGEALAKRFHEKYERLAPYHGYKTREKSAVPWDEVPKENKDLMIQVCAELLREGI